MHADRICLHLRQAAIDGFHHALAHQPQHPRSHLLGVMQHRTGLAPRHQRPFRRIATVRKGLGHHRQACLSRPVRQRRTRQHHQRQTIVRRLHGLDHIGGLSPVMRNGVVERTVRLHVAYLRACHARQRLQCPDLVDHPCPQIGRRHVHVAPPETGKIRIGHVCPDAHATPCSLAQRLQDARRVTGMKAAGHIGTGDDFQHRCIITHRPGAKTLAQVTVQVDSCHEKSPGFVAPYPSSVTQPAAGRSVRPTRRPCTRSAHTRPCPAPAAISGRTRLPADRRGASQ